MNGHKYIAWLGSHERGWDSVAVGGKKQVEAEAKAIFNSPNYQEFEGGKRTCLRITTYGRQLFVKSIVLSK